MLKLDRDMCQVCVGKRAGFFGADIYLSELSKYHTIFSTGYSESSHNAILRPAGKFMSSDFRVK